MRTSANLLTMEKLSPQLRDLVRQTVALLGEVIHQELGKVAYERIETLRSKMAALRSADLDEAAEVLRRELKLMQKLSPQQRLDVARAYTLMLEMMNACENAYRSHRIRRRVLPTGSARPEAVIYVLTAHPTEARSPQNIWVFHEILEQLVAILERPDVTLTTLDRQKLKHSLQIAWRAPINRSRKPKVEDEAEHIFSTLLRDETLRTLLDASQDLVPFYVRSWVGGDKDGHPGVDAEQFIASLELSRKKILEFCSRRLRETQSALEAIDDVELHEQVVRLEKSLKNLRKIESKDAESVVGLRRDLQRLLLAYQKDIGAVHPSLLEFKRLLHVFPGLVVPLEFRESSEVLLGSPSGKGLAIFRMLKALGSISKGGDPRWYVRGFIISMASEIEHLQVAAGMVKRALGDMRLPVIPLFEQAKALDEATKVVGALLKDPALGKAVKTLWNSRVEVMLGYSDSSKESGVLRSRLKVAESMHALDRFCNNRGVTPIFFQGSGGSTDRGGGTISEQTAWWSPSALRNYKVTIQGEMVERSLANPEITRGQVERIVESASVWKDRSGRAIEQVDVIDRFANRVAEHYQKSVRSDDFLQVVEQATPYPFLDQLRLGSRPSKRSKKVSVEGLRAIPWILCWTQTRVLFPTWWGIGTAWKNTPKNERSKILQAAKKHPLLSSYVRALGYTLAKVELPVWRLYLETSSLSKEAQGKFYAEFVAEHKAAKVFAQAALGTRQLVPYRPWLQDSIVLRSPMIHPLNLLQILAMREQDPELLRATVTGISAGMMTTG